MKLTKTQIYIIAGAVGIVIGAVIGRYVYINNTEVTEGQQNYTPEVAYEIKHGVKK